jgi:hypothetical protein
MTPVTVEPADLIAAVGDDDGAIAQTHNAADVLELERLVTLDDADVQNGHGVDECAAVVLHGRVVFQDLNTRAVTRDDGGTAIAGRARSSEDQQ